MFSFAPYKTLLEVLREDLGHTGTKHGCELGECGACAILLDGQSPCFPASSWHSIVAEGKVLTVEGLGQDGKPTSIAGCLCRSRSGAVRLLHAGNSGDGESSAGSEPSTQPRSDPRGNLRKPVPVQRAIFRFSKPSRPPCSRSRSKKDL